MPHIVTVHRALVAVKVTVPDEVDEDTFDDLMDEKIEAISNKVDMADAMKAALTDADGPLLGYEVEVEVS